MIKLLSEWRDPQTSLKIKPIKTCVVGEIKDQYITYPNNLRILWQYWKRVGAIAVARKIVSRRGERSRNRKVSAFGIGTVVEEAAQCSIGAGRKVLFFLYNHSCQEGIRSVDYRFVVEAPNEDHCPVVSSNCPDIPDGLLEYIGWSQFSGSQVDVHKIKTALLSLMPYFASVSSPSDPGLDDILIEERIEQKESISKKPSAVLFGLGNYAKTQILPNIKDYLDLTCIHEIDPDQLAPFVNSHITLDTSPYARENEIYNSWFIAGYHHTHIALAKTAMERGGVAVIEKPLSTTMKDFNDFKSFLKDEMKFFVCFHKRYLKFNDYIFQDLGISSKADSSPVDMNCLVYEIPLPKLHWYNWPNSGSRLISNGCHWIDHFMFLNSYAEVADASVKRMRGSDLLVSIKLINGATFVLNLTDNGSQRLGVRELIEVRYKDAQARIVDAAEYISENRYQIIRKKRVNPLTVYGDMYKEICSRIVNDKPGDSLDSLRSTEICLKLEEQLHGAN